MISLLVYLKENFYRPQDQMGFKDPATALMEQIIELHHFIFFFILLISGLVMWLLIQIIDNFIYLYHFNIKNDINKNTNLNKFLIYTYGVLSSKTRFFKEDKYLEACWTLLPAFILIAISIPSFYMLYLSEESIETLLTVKAVGFQWYWTYDFTDLFPFWYNLKTSEIDLDDFLIESYMEPTEYLNKEEGQFRLLETDNILMLPNNLHLSLIITSMDTLHSFALPSLGLKVDAVPGRLNKIDIFIYRMGVFYGQCSEICGIGHAFMPICLYAISYLNFLIGDL
jgi:cytochrome c oxidase subunit 2